MVTLASGSSGPNLGLGMGHGTTFQVALLLLAEKHIIWGDWAAWNSGGIKGLYSLDTGFHLVKQRGKSDENIGLILQLEER